MSLWSPSSITSPLTCLKQNMELLCKQCSGFSHHLGASVNFHVFSRVAAGTWVTFSSYGGDDATKLVFVKRCQDTCLVTRDTSGMSSRLGRAIRTLLDMRRETLGLFQVASVILGFLSIFKKRQASSPFEALNSACLSRYQRDVRTPVQVTWGNWAFSRVSTGDSDNP